MIYSINCYFLYDKDIDYKMLKIFNFICGNILSLFLINFSNFNKYEIANTFTLSIPNTVELRGQDDDYTKLLKRDYINKIDFNNIVFQQRGLASLDREAFNSYCRILIKVIEGYDFPSSTECYDLTQEDISYFRSMAKESAYPFEIIGNPIVEWILVNGNYAIEVKYMRKGEDNKHVKVSSYYLFNKTKVAYITLAYRKEDSKIWEEDFSKIIFTFKWIIK